MSTTPSPIPSVHGPYEDMVIALIGLFDKLIDGQTADQKAQLWANWINFWQPLINKISGK